MNIWLNGEAKELSAPCTLLKLVQDLGLDPQWVVAEHNLQVPNRTSWDEIQLCDEDQVELVRFMGGG
jgi:thiamine biosynthesis protein ThiS